MTQEEGGKGYEGEGHGEEEDGEAKEGKGDMGKTQGGKGGRATRTGRATAGEADTQEGTEDS